MPIRIKPVNDLGPCILDMESLRGICALVDQEFDQASYSSEDGIWEVYDEPSRGFLDAISSRKTLDSFSVKAGDNGVNPANKKLELHFDSYRAVLKLSATFDQLSWLEHFMLDLRKNLRPPAFRQRLGVVTGDEDEDPIPKATIFGGLVGGIFSDVLPVLIAKSRARYCYIILQRDPPNPFVENIKANLISNLIWVVVVFIAGVAVAFLSMWFYNTFGINVNDVLAPTTIPTSTPVP